MKWVNTLDIEMPFLALLLSQEWSGIIAANR